LLLLLLLRILQVADPRFLIGTLGRPVGGSPACHVRASANHRGPEQGPPSPHR
jgi:hypothetical protein